ncbi:hypothetical protein QBC40DRAFT_40115 [Triangularia verruculosa]|uniref:Transcription initiation factor TFIID subunit 4 n=1 Tax=Triangularia verruculosa TaxID=2587418 RepID=A0AAN7AP23_9PEZI|nr:hypothetical protein QBC40DRAFT_40115 [Triangularia verruculosa]
MAQPQPQAPQVPHPPQVSPHMQQMQQMQQQRLPQQQHYSPPQQSPSPANTPQPQYSIPPNKRPRTSVETPSQPQSQYGTPTYAMSPQATVASPGAVASPNYSNMPTSVPTGQSYAPQYGVNGHSASSPVQQSGLTLPEARPSMLATPTPTTPLTPNLPHTQQAQSHQPQQYQHQHHQVQQSQQHGQVQQSQQQHGQAQHTQQQVQNQQYQQNQPYQQPMQTQHAQSVQQPIQPQPTPQVAQQQYTNATMAPIGPPPPASTPGAMLPPSKPVTTKEYEYDVSDALAGTGVDLRAEEQYLAELYGGSFAQEARTGLPANAPGSKGSFYGAGPANQPVEATGLSQEQFEAEAAKRAWDEAAQRLAVTRANEIKTPFLSLANMHYRADKIAKEHGLTLNLELKNQQQTAGKLRAPQEFPVPKVTVTTRPGPDGVMVSTKGSFIPHDAYLADQLALLSIATKHRLRELLEEANGIATIRQTTSHGEIPSEWADVAVPLRTGLDSLPADTADGKSLKRSFDSFSSGQTQSKGAKVIKDINAAVRQIATSERDLEEARLRKRQKRSNPDAAQTGSRAGSTVPGTPGSVAPEGEAAKAPSKKELKKGAAAARLAEASSTASANQTLSALMGGFGRKKKKEYSWMTSGSGPSTPRATGGQEPGTPGGGAGSKAQPEKATLTQDGKTPRLGTWREDKEKGKNIQLRDWVTVLEMDGRDMKALQEAYVKLDASIPR